MGGGKMFFIFPMWDSQSQIIGMEKCTPLGYRLNSIARVLGTIGFYLLIITGIVTIMMHKGYFTWFEYSPFWLLLVPFTIGVIAQVLFMYSWTLASKKGFDYNYETREASWDENGKRVVYKWSSTNES
jgi:H+/Cl- antiporter ClcA